MSSEDSTPLWAPPEFRRNRPEPLAASPDSSDHREPAAYRNIVGNNPHMCELLETVERVAQTPARVLIEGEPGTGKELVARAIHRRSLEQAGIPQADGACPYLAVNCGAFSSTLLESQMFGHKKGAFTGATEDHEGVFVAAGSGTLFLDEISDLDPALQSKLLRVIQENEVIPVGANTPVPVAARIISATNRPLAGLVDAGEFRSDLFYRLNVVSIEIPPLRDRLDDIPALVKAIVASTAQRFDAPVRIPDGYVIEVFQRYRWPGNVRELNNVIERAFTLGTEPGRIRVEDLPKKLIDAVEGRTSESCYRDPEHFSTFDELIEGHLVRALERTKGIKSKAAKLLRVDRNRFSRMIKKYGLTDQVERLKTRRIG